MVKNVTVLDLALVELLDGSTAAPPDALERLRERGLIAITAGKAALTPKGRTRAEGLKPGEHDLQLLFAGATASNGGTALHTDAPRCSLHLTGGRAHIRA